MEAEVVGDGLADIGEGGAVAEAAGVPQGGGEGEQGDVLAGVIGGSRGRVAAMVGGDEQQISGAEGSKEIGDPEIDGFEGLRVAFRVVPVAVKHVEIDEIDENEAVGMILEGVEGPLHALGVGFGFVGGGDPAIEEDVGDLADADNGVSGFGEAVEEHAGRGRDGIVVAVGGPGEGAGSAKEGAGDDAADFVFPAQEITGDLAAAVQFIERDLFFVGGDLEDAVGGGIDDQIAAGEMLLAQFADNFGAGGGLVAEDAPASPGDEGVDDFGGKPGGVEREWPVEEDTGEFPVAGGGVLAGGSEGAAAEGGEGGGVGCEVIKGPDIGEAEALQVGERERSSGGEMAEGIAGFGVEESGPVGHGADAGAIENEQENAGEHGSVFGEGGLDPGGQHVNEAVGDEAVHPAEDAAGSGEDDGGGDGGNAEVGAESVLEIDFAGPAMPFEEGRDLVAVLVGGDIEEDDVVAVLEAGFGLLVEGMLGAARAAPGGPEVEDDDFAFEGVEGEWGAVEGGEGEGIGAGGEGVGIDGENAGAAGREEGGGAVVGGEQGGGETGGGGAGEGIEAFAEFRVAGAGGVVEGEGPGEGVEGVFVAAGLFEPAG